MPVGEMLIRGDERVRGVREGPGRTPESRASVAFDRPVAAQILFLQRAAGNSAVQQLLTQKAGTGCGCAGRCRCQDDDDDERERALSRPPLADHARRLDRNAFPGVVLTERAACLASLFGKMRHETSRSLDAACRRGRLTSVREEGRVYEDESDAFGHCWIGCQGSRNCGAGPTALFGTAHELYREYLDPAPHNSMREDMANQAYGRTAASRKPQVGCFEICLTAEETGRLELHRRGTRCYECSRRHWRRGCPPPHHILL